MELQKDIIIEYMVVAIPALALALSLLTLNEYLIALTGVLALALFVVYELWPIIEAQVFEHTNFIQLFNGFELSGSRTAAIAQTGTGYTATAGARLESLGNTDMDRQKVEKLIANINAPFKMVLQVERLNAVKMLEGLQTKKGIKEIELSRLLNPKTGRGLLTANRLKAEISFLEQEIRSIANGGMPLKLSYYLMTSARAGERHAARQAAELQLKALVPEFDATFGTRSAILSGNDLIELMRLDSAAL